MDALYINSFDKFIGENHNTILVEDDERKNANHILALITTGKDFGFICASRPTDNTKTNADRLYTLEEDIIKAKCSYIPFKCGWGYPGQGGCVIKQEETGLFVSGIELEELLELGKKYEQDVVVFGNKEEVKSYQTSNGKPDVILGATEMKLAMCTILFFPGTFRGR